MSRRTAAERRSGKSALAHDEWLEVANRDLSLMPTMRTLIALIRRGHLVGLAKRCKRALEMYTGPGQLGERKVYRSGTGSKGNCAPEKQLIYELSGHLLGKVLLPAGSPTVSTARKIEVTTVRDLKPKLKTVLKRTKLAREERGIPDDSASRMLNSVGLMYRGITANRAAAVELENIPEDEEDRNEEVELVGLVAEQVGNLTIEAEQEMDGMAIENDAAEEGEADDDEGVQLLHKHLLDDVWTLGWKEVSEMEVKKVRAQREARLKRKVTLMNVIVKKVKAMKAVSSAVAVGGEKEDVERCTWREYMHSLRPEYFR